MMFHLRRTIWAGLLALGTIVRLAATDVVTVEFPASGVPGELAFPATFHLWLPPSAKHIRAVIVHQHGCGDGAENSGETAALDLQWRALAIRHDAALLSPHYHAGDKQECRLWCDPRNGSAKIYLKALDALAQQTGHPELAQVPWCLWGHSGGAFWSSLMLEKYPERIVAIYCRSGAAATAWLKGEIPEPQFTAEAYRVPIILNPGLKERGDRQFNGAWDATSHFFDLFRSHHAPVAFAPDPLSSHDCRNSRLLALPFFDACLNLRLSRRSSSLKTIPYRSGWTGDWNTGEVNRHAPSATNLSWLPDSSTAEAFSQYVRIGRTVDKTPPRKAPVIVRTAHSQGQVYLEWTAEADFESGIAQFVIYRDGVELTRIPQRPNDRTGFAQFQGLSYHDTPTPKTPELQFADHGPFPNNRPTYRISTLNGDGMEGPKSKQVIVVTSQP